jgi:hypothetical protein
MAHKPQPTLTQMSSWSIFVVAAKHRWLGYVEAESEAAAIAEGAKQFRKPPNKLVAVRRIIATTRRR